MKSNKSDIIIYSENISAISSLMIGILSYIPIYKIPLTYLSAYITLSKSFNLINCSIYEYIHHIANAYMTFLFIYGNKIENDEHIEQFHIVNRCNISSFFLILSYKYKNIYIKMLFIISFIYYRTKFIYNVIHGFSSIDYVCMNHTYISTNNCIKSFNISNYVLLCLNIYWIGLILKKIYVNFILL